MPKTLGIGWRCGPEHPQAIYTSHEIALMRELREGGMPVKEIAARFECSKGFVSQVCNYKARTETGGRTAQKTATRKKKA